MNRLKPLSSPRAIQLLMAITFLFFPPQAFQHLAFPNTGKELGYVDHQDKSKQSSASAVTSGADPWTPENIMSTEVLAGIVKDTKSPQPVILYVGPAALYKRGRIPGAQFIGLTSKEEGLESLKKAASLLGKDSEIVVYCGCCPWEMCPNIRPAFQELQKQGFTKIRVLDLPNSFRQDWVTKGFPIEKTE